MTIKKAYVELVELLEANQNKKVQSILEQVYSMTTSNKMDSTVIRDADDNVIAIFCYYHKQWELISEVEYGKKASSKTGFNTMCKKGTSMWTKKQSMAKKAKEQLLIDVSNGNVDATDIVHLNEEIEANRVAIDMTDAPNGYANEDDLMAAIS